MTARQQWSVVLGVVLLLAVTLAAATHYLGDELFPVAVGLGGADLRPTRWMERKRTKTLADYKGKIVLVNVWATWCEPCRAEMPSMEKLYREFGPQGLVIVAVSVDDPGTEDQIRAFAKEYGLTFEILHDPDQGHRATLSGHRLSRVVHHRARGNDSTESVCRDGLELRRQPRADPRAARQYDGVALTAVAR